MCPFTPRWRARRWNYRVTSHLPSSPIVFASFCISVMTRPCRFTRKTITFVSLFITFDCVTFCRYDTRGQSHAEARHWSEEKILGGRAFFRGDLKPARLVIDKVKATDAGIYRCRADFYRAPTTISHMKLDVIGAYSVLQQSFQRISRSRSAKFLLVFWSTKLIDHDFHDVSGSRRFDLT